MEVQDSKRRKAWHLEVSQTSLLVFQGANDVFENTIFADSIYIASGNIYIRNVVH
jgi:hypothetical protein